MLAALAVAATLCVACGGHPEKRVVDQYFNAVNAQDNQTLASFAAVKLDKKVDNWKINETSPETRTPAELPALAKKVTDLELALADNKKAYNAYFLDHPKEVDQVRELLKKDAKIPANLQSYAADWQQFTQKKVELEKSLTAAKLAVEREKHNVALGLGNIDDVETLTGEMISKKLDLTLTINGQPQGYTMGLRKYDLSGASAGRVVSRWVIYSLQPKQG
jgi:hypothetical protein